MLTLIAMLKIVMKTAKITAFIVLYGLTFFPDSFFLSMSKHGISMYVLEIVWLSEVARNSIIDTHVFAIKPFAIVVFMNFALYL